MTYRGGLGYFLSRILAERNMTNRDLARGAGVSDSVIGNLLKHGSDEKAKDPDPRTLRAVADFLGINPTHLFVLTGYLPPQGSISVRAQMIGEAFDRMPLDRQNALLGVVEALAIDEQDKARFKEIYDKPGNVFAGIDMGDNHWLRTVANSLLKSGRVAQLDQYAFVDQNDEIPDGPMFSSLTKPTQERLLGLLTAKFALDYEDWMVDEDFRR